ncbi:hypothetical protein MMC22_011202 [Lobaria immixta]|nr:hypothetical protein [Lobaria immixta]
MFFIIFLQIVTTYMVSYLSKNLRPYNLYDIKEYGHVSYSRPPPSPQIYFPTSADYAEEYYLRSMSNLTVEMPSSLHLKGIDPCINLPYQETSSFRISYLPQLIKGIFHSLVKIASRVASTAVEIIVAILIGVSALGPPAAVAYALREQRKRDWDDLETRNFLSLVHFFWQVADGINSKCNVLKAQLQRSKEKLDSNKARFTRLEFLNKDLEGQLKSLAKLLRSQQESSSRSVNNITQERDALRKEHDALDLRGREKACESVVHQLHVTIERQDDQIKQRDKDLAAKQEDPMTKFTRHGGQIADHKDNLQAKMVEADQGFDQARHTSDERVLELEQSIIAQQKTGQDDREKFEGELKMAWEHIEGLLSTIRSNSRELQMHRDRAKAQRQVALSGYHPNYPASMPFTPAPTGMQLPQRQSPFAPQPTQIPGLPPNRTSGFMGNTPPPGWGRGAGTGRGTGLSRGTRGGPM